MGVGPGYAIAAAVVDPSRCGGLQGLAAVRRGRHAAARPATCPFPAAELLVGAAVRLQAHQPGMVCNTLAAGTWWRWRATRPLGLAAWRWRRSAATACPSASWCSTTVRLVRRGWGLGGAAVAEAALSARATPGQGWAAACPSRCLQLAISVSLSPPLQAASTAATAASRRCGSWRKQVGPPPAASAARSSSLQPAGCPARGANRASFAFPNAAAPALSLPPALRPGGGGRAGRPRAHRVCA